MEQYIIANCSDVGVARSVNEDSMVTFDSPNGRVVAVCDGMGGQAAGDVASQLACQIIRDILENNTFATADEAITRAIMAANQGILHRASSDPSLTGMGATCVMVIIKDGLAHYGWVGDSRIYYIANHNIRQISRDQSYVQQLVDHGELSPEEAERHPQKNEITNALGVACMTPPVIGKAIHPEAGSVILLCSDGLSGMVDNAHIERIVSDSQLSLHDRARKLIDKANAAGGLDNITVQLIQFVGDAAADKNARRKKSFSTATLIGCIVAGILLLGAGGWIAYSNYFADNKSKTSQSDDSSSASGTDVSRKAADSRDGKTDGRHDGGTDADKDTKAKTGDNRPAIVVDQKPHGKNAPKAEKTGNVSTGKDAITKKLGTKTGDNTDPKNGAKDSKTAKTAKDGKDNNTGEPKVEDLSKEKN